MTGSDRAVLYALACVSGFRAGELAALTSGAFDLGADVPTVRLAADQAKNGREAVQPLPPDMAAELRVYLAGKPSGAPVWPGTWPEKAAEMLRADLEAAGVPYAVEDRGRP